MYASMGVSGRQDSNLSATKQTRPGQLCARSRHFHLTHSLGHGMLGKAEHLQ